MSSFEDDDQVGFSITKVDYNPPRPVVHMVTSCNILVMALDNGKLIRLDLRDTSDLKGTVFSRLFSNFSIITLNFLF
jgi:hypothetical protein